MRIVEFQPDPIGEFRYLNAGRGPGQFYEDRLPVHVACVDALPEGVAALIATADLQGRERFEDAPAGPLRLLGEVLPARLVHEVLPTLSLGASDRIGVLLAGDFYTVPALDRRGGSGHHHQFRFRGGQHRQPRREEHQPTEQQPNPHA